VDYSVPAEENNALFIISNAFEAPVQARGNCTEDPNAKLPSYIDSMACSSNADCERIRFYSTRNGAINGFVSTIL
jgi:hypothetical protein